MEDRDTIEYHLHSNDSSDKRKHFTLSDTEHSVPLSSVVFTQLLDRKKSCDSQKGLKMILID